jgi:hypothetical protein
MVRLRAAAGAHTRGNATSTARTAKEERKRTALGKTRKERFGVEVRKPAPGTPLTHHGGEMGRQQAFFYFSIH